MGQYHESDDVLKQVSPTLVENTFSASLMPHISSIQSSHHNTANPETLSRIFNVGLDTARRTLRITTKQGIHQAVHPISCRYRVDHSHFNRCWLNSTFHTDTLFSKVQSLHEKKCAHVFINGAFTAIYPLVSKQQAGDSLREFINDVGIPDHLVSDLAGEHAGPHTKFQGQEKQ